MVTSICMYEKQGEHGGFLRLRLLGTVVGPIP